MKKKEFTEARSKDIKELKKGVDILRNEILKIKAEVKTSSEKNLKKIKNMRRNLSQTLTIIREKELMTKEGKEEVK